MLSSDVMSDAAIGAQTQKRTPSATRLFILPCGARTWVAWQRETECAFHLESNIHITAQGKRAREAKAFSIALLQV